MKKTLLITIALFISIIGYSQTFTENNITYQVNGTQVNITSYNTAGGNAVNIPLSVTNTTSSITYTVRGINSFVFQSKGLTSVVIGNNVESIGYAAFHDNELTTVIIPNSVTSIDAVAFANNKLNSVTIPNSVTSIGNQAFRNNLLETVTISDNITSIGEDAFKDNELTTVIIPDGVVSIGNRAFQSNNLVSITIPNTVTSIDYSAFANNALTSLTLSNNLTSIGDYVFFANQLTNITIPSSVTSIGNRAFISNPLVSVTALSTTPATITTGGANDSFSANRTNIDLFLPDNNTSTTQAYTNALWTGFKSVGVLSTQNFELNNNIKLLTTANKIKVTFSNNLKLQNYKIYNISGVEVSKGTQSEIPTNSLSSGIYILKLNFDKGKYTKKLIIN